MRWRVVVPVAAVLLAGLLLVREEGPGAAGLPGPVTRPPAVAEAPRSTPPLPASPPRNVFEYAVPAAPEPVTPRAQPPSAPPPTVTAPSPPAPPVRLVGVVHQAGALKAALMLRGELVILGEGEERDGYRVESIDEESGVRVAGPAGAVWTLAPD